MKKKMDNKGFSLVELIIVIAIMVILVAVLAPQYLKYVEKSRVATDVQTTVEFINALQVLAADPDVMLEQDEAGTKYTVKSGNTGDDDDKKKITVSDPLKAKLIEAGQLTDTDFNGNDSTSTYQSSGYAGAKITIALKYDKDTATWSVTTEGVDSSGKLPETPAGS